MNNQTAVELLIDQLKTNYGFKTYLYDEFKEALAIEKQQICEAYTTGVEDMFDNNPLRTGEMYYNETYIK